MSTRQETDTLGVVEVDTSRYWGAQTQRSLEHFDIGSNRFRWGRSMIRALGIVKLAAARANADLGELDQDIAQLIISAAQEVIDGDLDDHFPLVVFQTGSGTQSNMNANEVIANRANEIAGAPLGSKRPVHPNDHVNRGQSSNDAFPTAMHIAVTERLHDHLVPALTQLIDTLSGHAQAYRGLVKIGRTHLQDATPVTLGQEINAWAEQISQANSAVLRVADGLLPLAIGGTAVGTGLNAHPHFGERAAQHMAQLTGFGFSRAANPFVALASHDPLSQLSGMLRTLAGALLKMANDVRWLASGPRCGIGELHLPENEPGSSIMPGKVNPTQCEALTMVCAQVFGNDAAVAFAASQGNFQLNVYKPVIVHNVLESIDLLGDATLSFDQHCARGIEPDEQRIAQHLANNLMLVTALVPHIGYDQAATIAKKAMKDDSTLRAAAISSGKVSASDFDTWVEPLPMTDPKL